MASSNKSSTINVASVIDKIIGIVNSSGQGAICKKGNILREKSGKICGEDKSIAVTALFLCASDLDFQKSDCANKAKEILKEETKNISPYNYASEHIKKSAESYKGQATLCQFNKEKLTGNALKLAQDFCPDSQNKSQATNTSTPSVGQKLSDKAKSLKSNLETLVRGEFNIIENLKDKLSKSKNASDPTPEQITNLKNAITETQDSLDTLIDQASQQTTTEDALKKKTDGTTAKFQKILESLKSASDLTSSKIDSAIKKLKDMVAEATASIKSLGASKSQQK